MDFMHPSIDDPWFSVRDIKLDGNELSGGNFSAELQADLVALFLPETMRRRQLHAGIFGENAEEIAGTLRMSGTDIDNEAHCDECSVRSPQQ